MSETYKPIRVAVLGSRGRMGTEVCRAVRATEDMELVALVDDGDEITAVTDAGADVVVDFTTPSSVMGHVQWCVNHGVHAVVGTSGLTETHYEQVRSWLDNKPGVAVTIVPNFAIGAVLMMEFAAKAARFFDSVEIIESHHPQKTDAPSGTAIRTAEMVTQARMEAGCGSMPDATSDSLAGARGADVEGVRVHSVRAAGLVAHQEVLFGTAGQTLTIRHDSYDRKSFMPGVVLAIRATVGSSGLTVGLSSLLGL